MSGHTGLLAAVRSAAEARTALGAGADAVLLAGLDETTVPEDIAVHAFRIGAGVDGLAGLDPLSPDDLGEARLEAIVARGGQHVLLDAGAERIVDRLGFPALSRFAESCRASGLAFSLKGGLEAPDVARLLPLRPAFLAFDEATRDAGGALDPEAVAALGELFAPVVPPGRRGDERPDRIFIKDFDQSIEIGAYGSEHGRRQRVRFSVEAEFTPVRARRSMANVYSYDLMMDAVRDLVARDREAFVETLAEALADAILADHRVLAVTVRVEKLDLGPASAGVEIYRERA